ncbi:MAG: ribosome maturation factor RimM [Candidatus Rickettsia vulgarisii]
MSNKEKLVLVGKIVSAQGIQGNVMVKSFTEPVENIMKLELVDKIGQKIVLKLVRRNSNNNLVCKFNSVNNRTEAEELKGLEIFCYRENLPVLNNNDEFYIEDLIGLDVLDNDLVRIGNVKNIFNFGAGDIIEIKFINNQKIELFPFNKQFFPTVTKNHIILSL